MAKLDDSTLKDWLTSFGSIVDGLVGEDFPVIVGVIERISRHLLPLTGYSAVVISERIFVWMAMEICLCVFMTESDEIVVEDVNSLRVHDVVTERFLKFRGHEVVSRPRSREDGEMNLEPEQVKEERYNDQTDCSGHEVLAKCDHVKCSLFSIDIEQGPQVNADCAANCEESEGSNVFR